MKTVKFKDLPEKVRVFFRREIRLVSSCEYISLDKLHTLQEWSKATDEERLAYAEWKYPKGTGLNYKERGFAKSIGKPYIASGDRLVAVQTDHKNRGGNCSQFYPIYENGGWAEIVGESEKEDVEMNTSIKRENEQILSEDSEPTFKAGDMVEWARPDAFTKLENSWNKKPAYYTGGIAKSGLYICQDEEDKIIYPSHIRKCDPDKAYREMAKEMMSKTATHKFGGWSGEFKSIEDVELMLIEAIKKGKEL